MVPSIPRIRPTHTSKTEGIRRQLGRSESLSLPLSGNGDDMRSRVLIGDKIHNATPAKASKHSTGDKGLSHSVGEPECETWTGWDAKPKDMAWVEASRAERQRARDYEAKAAANDAIHVAKERLRVLAKRAALRVLDRGVRYKGLA